MAKNLVIVESPAKAKTIEGYLGKDYVVKSSFGHVRDLVKNGKAIDVENNFEPKYEVSTDKKNVVSELKKLVKEAQTVWLATDEDREGEAISWHLYETLGLHKKDTKRITFNEITKTAILNAIQNPRTINQELVDAQQARRILDRLVGFELSPVLWKKVRPNLSAGRVQSVAVRLIVEREKEIERFQTSSFYKVNGLFGVTNGTLKAELNRNLNNESEVDELLDNCKGAKFTISSVDKKPSIRKPVAPFTTSTLQQEASLKLGFSVSRTMSVAQKLYESGKITYMRTDSVNLSDTAIEAAKNEITNSWGPQYSNPQKYKTKSAGAQEAHEAIRPTDFSVHSITGDFDEQRLYSLIWKRAISSQMSDALLERTTIKIESDAIKDYFQSKGEVITFDGFLKVYMETTNVDDEEEEENGLLPMVNVGEESLIESITSTQRFTRPPSRYVEASLVKELEKRGIGRPSTYAPTISTIQKRGYVEKMEREGMTREYTQWTLSSDEITKKTLTEVTGKESGKLSPSDIGIVVTEFLSKHFDNIMDYNFTADVESQFDEIANGNIKWTKMMKDFYDPFHKSVTETTEKSERASGERELGIDPKSGRKVIVRIGKFGPMVQIGKEDEDGEKSKFAALRKTQSITNITLDEALDLFKLPRTLGEYEGKEIKANIGRFGPYVQFGTLFVSIKGEDPMEIEFDKAIELIKQKQLDDANKIIKTFDGRDDVQILNGRWGAYLKVGKDNYKLPKDKKSEDLTLEECLEIMGNQPQKKKTFKKKK